MCELFDEDYAYQKLKGVLEVKNVLLRDLYHKPELSADEVFENLMKQRDAIRPYVGDTFRFLRSALKEGKNILLEGQLGALKDPDYGIYPMVTSSSTLAGYGAVGAGAFVSEIFGDEAQEMRVRGGDSGEFGATTGRPRRMGWFDCVASRYGVQAQGATEVALTVVDALGYLCLLYTSILPL